MRVLPALAVLAVGVVVVVAIGNAARGGDGNASGVVDLVMEDLRFSPNQVNAAVGVPVSVRVTNRGTERHDLSFPSLHMPGLEGIETILAPGETRTFTLQFDQPGTHTFICSLPGHAAAGMTGAVIVRQ